MYSQTREATLSVALHRAALPYVYRDWSAARRVMQFNLDRMKMRRRAPLAEGWVAEWQQALNIGPEAVEQVALMPGERGDDLRQMTPFAGVLPQDVRLEVIRQVRNNASL